MKKVLSVLAVILLLIGITGNTVEAKSKIALNKTSISVQTGDTYQLKVSGTTKNATWKSQNSAIAKVSKKGVVSGVKAGKTTVECKVAGKKLKCKVTVKNKKLPTIKASASSKMYWGVEVKSIKVTRGTYKGKKVLHAKLDLVNHINQLVTETRPGLKCYDSKGKYLGKVFSSEHAVKTRKIVDFTFYECKFDVDKVAKVVLDSIYTSAPDQCGDKVSWPYRVETKSDCKDISIWLKKTELTYSKTYGAVGFWYDLEVLTCGSAKEGLYKITVDAYNSKGKKIKQFESTSQNLWVNAGYKSPDTKLESYVLLSTDLTTSTISKIVVRISKA